jgi:hypothetical protein
VRWFVDITSWEPIAMDLRQLVRAFDGGRIDADTLVWRKGMPDWRRLRDVPELAERLMGPDAAAKATAPEAPLEAGSAGSEPPQMPADVRQNQNRAERSRTPPANYSVDERAADLDPRVSAADRKEATPSSEAAATMPGASGVPHTPPGGYGSPEPPRAQPTDRRSRALSAASGMSADGAGFGAVRAAPRRNPGSAVISAKSGSTQMGLSAPGLTASSGGAPAEQRTITQTGLAPAGDPGGRASLSPAHSGNSVLEAPEARAGEAEVEAARVAPSPSPRNSRSATPAPGARRRPNSDETPAQKPASISVSSGALAQASARPRGKVAIGVLLLGAAGAMMVRATRPTDSPMVVPAAAPERQPAVAASDPPRIEKSAPLPLEPVPEPKPAAPQATAPSSPTAAPAPTPVPAKAAPADPMAQNPARLARNSAPPATAAPAVHAPSKPAPAPAVSAPRLDIHPSLPEAPATPSAEPPVTGRAEIAAPAAPPPPASVPERATTTPAIPPPAVAPPTAVPPTAAPPTAAPAPPATATPALFDEKRAREQMGLAAFKASTCNQLGDTRGSGQVNVVIQSWGRVVRVTHLNQAFVGTPVGLCIMEAFQQVQVPPFEGGPRTLVGSFLVQ